MNLGPHASFIVTAYVLTAIVVGTVESLIARFRLRSVPTYIALALGSGAVALLATAWQGRGGP